MSSEELLKVSKFYTLRRQDLEASISIFSHIHTAKEKLVTRSGSVDLRHRQLSLWRAIHQVHRNLWCWEVFCEVNVLAGKQLVGKVKKEPAEIAERVGKMLQAADFPRFPSFKHR